MALLNRCPVCGSKKIKKVISMTGCGFQLTQLMLMLTLVGIPIALMMHGPKDARKCRKCGAKWEV